MTPPDLMKDERVCFMCGYIGKKKHFDRPFGTRGAGSGGSCPSCQRLHLFAGDSPPPREQWHRWNRHAYEVKTCGRCGLALRPLMAMSEHVKYKHYLSECDDLLDGTNECASVEYTEKR